MSKNKIIFGICSELMDKITITRGYLQLNIERQKVDYSPILLKGIDDIHADVIKIIDVVNSKNESEE